MLIVGVTGNIGMGKSTVAKALAGRCGAHFDADAVVHRLLGEGGAGVELVGKWLPEAKKGEAIDRKLLADEVFADPSGHKLRELEAMLHPLVGHVRQDWIKRCRLQRKPLAVLDIPLLFETGAVAVCDAVVVTSCPEYVQYHRLKKRSGLSLERMRQVVKRQWPMAYKLQNADYIIYTGLSRADTMRQVQMLRYALSSLAL